MSNDDGLPKNIFGNDTTWTRVGDSYYETPKGYLGGVLDVLGILVVIFTVWFVLDIDFFIGKDGIIFKIIDFLK
jgi:hypothetical protein